MAHFLVTGGCGFIGANLVAALIGAGHDVRVLDDLSTGKPEALPPGADLHVGSITDAGAVAAAMAGIDGCFHLASNASVTESLANWAGSHAVNMAGFIHVLDEARRRPDGPLPVIYASSAAVYGDNPDLPLGEDAPPAPLSAYAADKIACEMHARIAGSLYGVPTFGLRFFNVYGPGQAPDAASSGVVAIFARALLDGRPLDVYGDGAQIRDFVYVDDAVGFLMKAMERATPAGTVLNVCSGRGTSVTSLIDALTAATGLKPEVRHHAARAGEILASTGDPAAARDVLGLTAATPLGTGITETLAWLRKGGGSAD